MTRNARPRTAQRRHAHATHERRELTDNHQQHHHQGTTPSLRASNLQYIRGTMSTAERKAKRPKHDNEPVPSPTQPAPHLQEIHNNIHRIKSYVDGLQKGNLNEDQITAGAHILGMNTHSSYLSSTLSLH